MGTKIHIKHNIRNRNLHKNGYFKQMGGQSLVELAVGLIVGLPLVLVIIDLCLCGIAVGINDSAAQNAARLAATGRPTSNSYGSEDASQRAKSFLQGVYQCHGYVKGPLIIGKFLPDDPNTGPQGLRQPPEGSGGSYGGVYRVTTQVIVTLPAFIPSVTPQTVTFHSRQECTITKCETSTKVPL